MQRLYIYQIQQTIMSKFKDQYRIASTRLPLFDYSSTGSYFITICTENRNHFFGECDNGKMKLSTIGAIVQGFWYEIPRHFPFITLDEFIVMPNHIHGILILNKSEQSTSDNFNINESNEETKDSFFQKISPKPGSIPVIIRSYKSICTKHIHAAFSNLNFNWQERFWDTIIDNEASFQNISNYIINNSANWKSDKFYNSVNV